MSVPTSLYVPGDSWLHRLDPRLKLLFAVLSVPVLMTMGSLSLFVVFLGLCHVALLSARVPATRLAWAWRLMLPVTILIPVLWPLFAAEPGPLLVQVGPMSITWPTLWRGLAMAARVDAMAFACFVWLLTTDQTHLVLSCSGLGLPYEWGLMLAIALRYIPTLYALYGQVMDAQYARGLVIPRANPVRAARAYLPALVPVLINALRMSENLARSLEARAFGAPGRRRTARRTLRFTPTDALALGVIVAGSLGLLVARLVWGFGQGPL